MAVGGGGAFHLVKKCWLSVASSSVTHDGLLEQCREQRGGGGGVLGQLFSHVSTLQLPVGVRASLDPEQVRPALPLQRPS